MNTGNMFMSFLILLTTWIGFRASYSHRYLKYAFTLGTIVSFFSMARGAILAFLGIFLIGAFRKQIVKYYQVFIVGFLFPAAILALPAELTSGRKRMVDFNLGALNFFGNGIGASANISNQINMYDNYVHNIHLELAVDWGLGLYLVCLASAIYFLMKKRALLTIFFIFIVCSFSYTIYSPWTWISILFAYQADSFFMRYETNKMPRKT